MDFTARGIFAFLACSSLAGAVAAVLSRRKKKAGHYFPVGPGLPWWLIGFILMSTTGLPDTSSKSLDCQRTVPIIFAIDYTIRGESLWRTNIERMVQKAGLFYGKQFGICFETHDIVNWTPGGESLEDFLDNLMSQVGAAPNEIVVGLTFMRPQPFSVYGLTCYQDAIMVLSLEASPHKRTLPFLHELGHVFGAVNLRDASGLMSIDEPSEELDRLNTRLIELNRGRRFAPHLFPLEPEKLPAALELYRRAKDEATEDTTIVLAQIALELGEVEAALSYAEELISRHSGSVEAHNLRGIALRMLGRADEAVAAYREVIERRPSHAQAHYNLAIACEKLGRTGEAMAAYEKALDLQPEHPRALSNLSRLLAQEGRVGRATDCAEKALRIDPDFADARVNLAFAYLKKGDTDGAIKESRRAVEQRPDLAEAYEIMGAALFDSGNFREAARHFMKATKISPREPRFIHQLAVVREALGLRDQASETLDALLDEHPDYLPALVDLGAIQIRTGRTKEAFVNLNRAVSIEPENPVALANLAAAQLVLGDVDGAEKTCNHALALKPDLPAALATMGLLAAGRGHFAQALELQRRAATGAPRNADIIENLATIYHQLGKRAEAVETYVRVLELRPDDAVCHNNLAVLYYREGDFRSARRHVDRARALGWPVHPDFLVALEKAENRDE